MLKKSLFILLGIISMSTALANEAIFAMGCFWCGESEFRDHQNSQKMLPGIIAIEVGYEGGENPNATYENHAGAKEAVKITFDPARISYDTLLNIFWHNIDPFDEKGQFCDKGFAYTSAIFYSNQTQKIVAENSKRLLEAALHRPIVTDIQPAGLFVAAEEYHQNYKFKNPIRYNFYRWNCGRDQRLKELWGEKAHAN